MSGKDTLRELVSFDPHFLIRCHQLIQAGAPYINGLKKKHTLKSRVAHLNSLILVEDDHSQGILLNQRPQKGIRIRLCKGAYKEPEDIAFQKKSEVDASYVKLMKILMKSGIYHGLATHDEAISASDRARKDKCGRERQSGPASERGRADQRRKHPRSGSAGAI